MYTLKMNSTPKFPEHQSVFFYNTESLASECNSLWSSSLRGERCFTSIFMQPQSDEQLQERKKNFLRKHSRSPTKKELAEGVTCEACHRPSRRDIDTPEYWRRVRSLSRENRLRLDSRENQLRLAEHEEAKRRKEILTRRKNEREDLANRFLRNPLKAFRNCSVDTEDGKGDRSLISRSVPDLEEAYKVIREGQLAKARSQTLTNSTYESWAKQKDRDTPLVCHKYLYESLTNQNSKECSTSPRKNKKENQKAYPTRSKEELLARHSRYHHDDQIPFSRTSRLRRKKSQKDINDKRVKSFDSNSLPDGNIIMVQKPKFIRRRSMPDLSKCKCIRSTVVFESVASLDNPQYSEEVIILQRPPSRYRSSDTKLKVSNSSSTVRKNLNYRNSSKNKTYASQSNSVDEIYSKANKQLITCTEKYMKTSSYFQISRRKEWTADQVSKSELKRLVIPKKDLRPNNSTTQSEPLPKENNSAILNKKNLTDAEGNESNFYDSLEEVNERGHKNNKAFFISLDDDDEQDPRVRKPYFVSFGEESESSSINEIMLSPQSSSRIPDITSHQRPRTAFSKIKELGNLAPKVFSSEIEALLLSGNNQQELEHISEFAAKSLDLNKNGKLHLSSTSIDLLSSKLPELSTINSEFRKLSAKKRTVNHSYNHDDVKVSGNDQGSSINGYIDIISDKVFLIRNESRIVNVNNNNKDFESCTMFSNSPCNSSNFVNNSDMNRVLTNSNELMNDSNDNVADELPIMASEIEATADENKTYSIDSFSDNLSISELSADENAVLLNEHDMQRLHNKNCKGKETNHVDDLTISAKPCEEENNIENVVGFAAQSRENLLESGFGGDEDMSSESDCESVSSKDSLNYKNNYSSYIKKYESTSVMQIVDTDETGSLISNDLKMDDAVNDTRSREDNILNRIETWCSQDGSEQSEMRSKEDILGKPEFEINLLELDFSKSTQEADNKVTNSSIESYETVNVSATENILSDATYISRNYEDTINPSNTDLHQECLDIASNEDNFSTSAISDGATNYTTALHGKLSDNVEDRDSVLSFDAYDDGSDSTASSELITVIRYSPGLRRNCHSVNSLSAVSDLESDMNTPTRLGDKPDNNPDAVALDRTQDFSRCSDVEQLKNTKENEGNCTLKVNNDKESNPLEDIQEYEQCPGSEENNESDVILKMIDIQKPKECLTTDYNTEVREFIHLSNNKDIECVNAVDDWEETRECNICEEADVTSTELENNKNTIEIIDQHKFGYVRALESCEIFKNCKKTLYELEDCEDVSKTYEFDNIKVVKKNESFVYIERECMDEKKSSFSSVDIKGCKESELKKGLIESCNQEDSTIAFTKETKFENVKQISNDIEETKENQIPELTETSDVSKELENYQNKVDKHESTEAAKKSHGFDGSEAYINEFESDKNESSMNISSLKNNESCIKNRSLEDSEIATEIQILSIIEQDEGNLNYMNNVKENNYQKVIKNSNQSDSQDFEDAEEPTESCKSDDNESLDQIHALKNNESCKENHSLEDSEIATETQILSIIEQDEGNLNYINNVKENNHQEVIKNSNQSDSHDFKDAEEPTESCKSDDNESLNQIHALENNESCMENHSLEDSETVVTQILSIIEQDEGNLNYMDNVKENNHQEVIKNSNQSDSQDFKNAEDEEPTDSCKSDDNESLNQMHALENNETCMENHCLEGSEIATETQILSINEQDEGNLNYMDNVKKNNHQEVIKNSNQSDSHDFKNTEEPTDSCKSDDNESLNQIHALENNESCMKNHSMEDSEIATETQILSIKHDCHDFKNAEDEEPTDSCKSDDNESLNQIHALENNETCMENHSLEDSEIATETQILSINEQDEGNLNYMDNVKKNNHQEVIKNSNQSDSHDFKNTEEPTDSCKSDDNESLNQIHALENNERCMKNHSLEDSEIATETQILSINEQDEGNLNYMVNVKENNHQEVIKNSNQSDSPDFKNAEDEEPTDSGKSDDNESLNQMHALENNETCMENHCLEGSEIATEIQILSIIEQDEGNLNYINNVKENNHQEVIKNSKQSDSHDFEDAEEPTDSCKSDNNESLNQIHALENNETCMENRSLEDSEIAAETQKLSIIEQDKGNLNYMDNVKKNNHQEFVENFTQNDSHGFEDDEEPTDSCKSDDNESSKKIYALGNNESYTENRRLKDSEIAFETQTLSRIEQGERNLNYMDNVKENNHQEFVKCFTQSDSHGFEDDEEPTNSCKSDDNESSKQIYALENNESFIEYRSLEDSEIATETQVFSIIEQGKGNLNCMDNVKEINHHEFIDNSNQKISHDFEDAEEPTDSCKSVDNESSLQIHSLENNESSMKNHGLEDSEIATEAHKNLITVKEDESLISKSFEETKENENFDIEDIISGDTIVENNSTVSEDIIVITKKIGFVDQKIIEVQVPEKIQEVIVDQKIENVHKISENRDFNVTEATKIPEEFENIEEAIFEHETEGSKASEQHHEVNESNDCEEKQAGLEHQGFNIISEASTILNSEAAGKEKEYQITDNIMDVNQNQNFSDTKLNPKNETVEIQGSNVNHESKEISRMKDYVCEDTLAINLYKKCENLEKKAKNLVLENNALVKEWQSFEGVPATREDHRSEYIEEENENNSYCSKETGVINNLECNKLDKNLYQGFNKNESYEYKALDYEDELLLINDGDEELENNVNENELLAEIFSARNLESHSDCPVIDSHSDLSTIEEENDTYVSTTDDTRTDESLQYEDIASSKEVDDMINSDSDNDITFTQMHVTNMEAKNNNSEQTLKSNSGEFVKFISNVPTCTQDFKEKINEVQNGTEVHFNKRPVNEMKDHSKVLQELDAEKINLLNSSPDHNNLITDTNTTKTETHLDDKNSDVENVEKNIEKEFCTSLKNNTNCFTLNNQIPASNSSNSINNKIMCCDVDDNSFLIDNFKSNSCKTTIHKFPPDASIDNNESSISISEKIQTNTKEEKKLKKPMKIGKCEGNQLHSKKTLSEISGETSNINKDTAKRKLQFQNKQKISELRKSKNNSNNNIKVGEGKLIKPNFLNNHSKMKNKNNVSNESKTKTKENNELEETDRSIIVSKKFQNLRSMEASGELNNALKTTNESEYKETSTDFKKHNNVEASIVICELIEPEVSLDVAELNNLENFTAVNVLTASETGCDPAASTAVLDFNDLDLLSECKEFNNTESATNSEEAKVKVKSPAIMENVKLVANKDTDESTTLKKYDKLKQIDTMESLGAEKSLNGIDSTETRLQQETLCNEIQVQDIEMYERVNDLGTTLKHLDESKQDDTKICHETIDSQNNISNEKFEIAINYREEANSSSVCQAHASIDHEEEYETPKSQSSDSGVMELAGPSNSKSSTSLTSPIVLPTNNGDDAGQSEHYSEHSTTVNTVLESNAKCMPNMVNAKVEALMSKSNDSEESSNSIYGVGELPNTPILSDCEITANVKNRLVYSYLDTLDDAKALRDLNGIHNTAKLSNSKSFAQTPSFSSDDECDSSSNYTTRLLNAFETRRKRRSRPRPHNIDSDELRNKTFRAPTLTNFDSFLSSLSRFTTNDGDESENQSYLAEGKNGVRIEVYSGQNTHDIKVKAKNQVRLLVEVNPSSPVAPSKQRKNNSEVSSTKNLQKSKTRSKQENILENEHIFRRSISQSSCDITVEGTNIRKCFSVTTKMPVRPLLKAQNRVNPSAAEWRQTDDPKEREHRRVQQSIRTITNLLKNFH